MIFICIFSSDSDSVREEFVISDEESEDGLPSFKFNGKKRESSDDEEVSIVYESKGNRSMTSTRIDDNGGGGDDDDVCVIVSDDEDPVEKRDLSGSGGSSGSVGQKRKSEESSFAQGSPKGEGTPRSPKSNGGRIFEIIEADDEDESIICKQKRVKHNAIPDSDSSMSESLARPENQEEAQKEESKSILEPTSPTITRRRSVATFKRSISPELSSESQAGSPQPSSSDEDEKQKEEDAYDRAFEDNDDVDESVIEKSMLQTSFDPSNSSYIVEDSFDRGDGFNQSGVFAAKADASALDSSANGMNSTSESVEDSDN